METCEFLNTCSVFSGLLANKPQEAAAVKEKFCQSSYLHCALYMVGSALGASKMPGDMEPTDKGRAYEIIAQG